MIFPVPEPEAEALRECPSCALDVPARAEVCPYCAYEFPRQRSSLRLWALVMALLLAWPALKGLLWLIDRF